MNSLLIHLSGYLSAEMGSELYLKIKETSRNPSLFCLDCSLLSAIDEVGAEYLKKIAVRLAETFSRLAITGCGEGLKESLLLHKLDTLFPIFPSEKEAMTFLESQVFPTQPANESNQTDAKVEIYASGNPEETRFIFCPSCSQKLKFTKVGDHLCPTCQNKFSVNKRGWTSVYERLV
ncbi:STAS domain-containing protein [Leptospira ognonensis]|uniref:STAS domain-containing protein n=1 Tax=Leptospira ognonensis TaxID=2484945 RepID=A0A4R9K6R3_9LEPT|nr:STAS domain-containing protein [Leptospira ognonensis]TGL61979.1 STAS domain-containing protein [Leptospira ognonensis]